MLLLHLVYPRVVFVGAAADDALVVVVDVDDCFLHPPNRHW